MTLLFDWPLKSLKEIKFAPKKKANYFFLFFISFFYYKKTYLLLRDFERFEIVANDSQFFFQFNNFGFASFGTFFCAFEVSLNHGQFSGNLDNENVNVNDYENLGTFFAEI